MNLAEQEFTDDDQIENANTRQFLTVFIAGQRFGIPILEIEDVLRQQRLTKIPLAPYEVAGALNLRGRIVTAIDVRKRLGLESLSTDKAYMSVVVEHEGELYSLIIDEVGDVLVLNKNLYEKNPGTLDSIWREISQGIYRLEKDLLVVLDIPKLLDTVHN